MTSIAVGREELTSITLDHRCTSCGGQAHQAFGERVSATKLWWHESWWCDGCSLRSEADGIDRLPDDLRRHTIAAEGSFTVHVTPRDRPGVLRALRSEFGMTVAGALAAFRALDRPLATSLTHAEARRVANAFPDDAAVVRIVREATSATQGVSNRDDG